MRELNKNAGRRHAPQGRSVAPLPGFCPRRCSIDFTSMPVIRSRDTPDCDKTVRPSRYDEMIGSNGEPMPRLKTMTPSLRVGTSTTRRNLTISPVFADTNVRITGYVPLGVALQTGSARITEVSESGSVPTLAFENL